MKRLIHIMRADLKRAVVSWRFLLLLALGLLLLYQPVFYLKKVADGYRDMELLDAVMCASGLGYYTSALPLLSGLTYADSFAWEYAGGAFPYILQREGRIRYIVCVNGQYVGQEVEFPARTGILIESPGFIPYYSGYKNLQVLAELNYRTTDAMVRNAISLVGLSADEKKSVGKYSLGMRQRLGIAQALMENPQLLILDEPMNGLDNKGVSDMRMLFKKLRHEGKTILLASHNPLDIDELCDTVCEMDAGVLKRKL